MQDRSKSLIIFAIYLASALIQCFWHWLLSQHFELLEKYVQFYLYYDSKSRKGTAGWFDLVLPCIWVGILTGYLAWNWSSGKLKGWCFLLGCGLAALLPVYAFILQEDGVWWWPTSVGAILLIMATRTMEAVLMVGVSAYGGRQIRLYRNGQK